jgi:flagellar biosynthesis/type III secretory pathway protein FliH
MVINKDPNYDKKRQAEAQLNQSEDVRKEALIAELRKESVSIICLALMYAKNFEETQEDLTKRLLNVEQNADLLQRIYNKGYEEGIEKGKELEREQNNSRKFF